MLKQCKEGARGWHLQTKENLRACNHNNGLHYIEKPFIKYPELNTLTLKDRIYKIEHVELMNYLLNQFLLHLGTGLNKWGTEYKEPVEHIAVNSSFSLLKVSACLDLILVFKYTDLKGVLDLLVTDVADRLG